jgi:hypothetical protein
MSLKDSFGNEIPAPKPCNSGTAIDECLYQLQLTYFYIAIGQFLEKGHKVLYDKNSKKAIITKKDGEKVELEHN